MVLPPSAVLPPPASPVPSDLFLYCALALFYCDSRAVCVLTSVRGSPLLVGTRLARLLLEPVASWCWYVLPLCFVRFV